MLICSAGDGLIIRDTADGNEEDTDKMWRAPDRNGTCGGSETPDSRIRSDLSWGEC